MSTETSENILETAFQSALEGAGGPEGETEQGMRGGQPEPVDHGTTAE